MCVNDLVCQGAEPLFFLDYFATGKLEIEQAARIIEGIAAGCEVSGCALIGGETAEMPGMYPAGISILAGFASARWNGAWICHAVRRAMFCWGLASDGVHSNGYSLVRKLVEQVGPWLGCAVPMGRGHVGRVLLTPTRLYVKAALAAIKTRRRARAWPISRAAVLTENLPRVLPKGLGADIDLTRGICRRVSAGWRKRAGWPRRKSSRPSTPALA